MLRVCSTRCRGTAVIFCGLWSVLLEDRALTQHVYLLLYCPQEARRITYHMFSVLAHYIFCSPLLTTAGTTKASDATRLPTSVAITVFILCSLALSGDYTVRAQRAQSTANSRSGCVFIHDGRWERMECDIYGGVIKTLTKSRRILPPHENEIEDR